MAAGFLPYDGLADLFGERHRIIANDWQAASMGQIAGRVVLRPSTSSTPSPSPQRRSGAGGHGPAAARLYSAGELLDHAADLLSDSAGLVHDNERRWRTFRARVDQLVTGHLSPSGQ